MEQLTVVNRVRTQVGSSGCFESMLLSTQKGEKCRIDNFTFTVGSANVGFGVVEAKGKVGLLVTVRDGEKIRVLSIDRDTGEVREFSAEAPAEPLVSVTDPVEFANMFFGGGLSEEEKSKVRDFLQQMGGLKGLAGKMKTYKPLQKEDA